MDGSWPDVLGKIRQTGAFEALGADSQGKGKGPNHVRIARELAELERRADLTSLDAVSGQRVSTGGSVNISACPTACSLSAQLPR